MILLQFNLSSFNTYFYFVLKFTMSHMLSFNSQILGNINVTSATISSFQTGFISTVASFLNISDNTVTITDTVATQSARRLLAAGVQINYDIKSSSALNQIENALNGAISSGAFGNVLRRNTGTTVTSSATLVVAVITPTYTPTPLPSSSTENEGGTTLGTTPIILIAVLGFFGVLVMVLGLLWYFGMFKRKRRNRTSITVSIRIISYFFNSLILSKLNVRHFSIRIIPSFLNFLILSKVNVKHFLTKFIYSL